MKRSAPLRRKSDIRTKNLSTNVTPRRRRRLKPRSAARIALAYGDYVALRLARDPFCRVQAPGCTGRAQGLHHLRKRSASGRVKSRLNTLRSCNPCNGWIEDHPAQAHRMGLVVRPGDPMWRWLGARLPSGRRL